MAALSKRLAESLAALKEFQDRGQVAVRAADLTRTHRERLLKNGFIRQVMKGWYVPTRPDEPTKESTSWYACFWGFCAAYLTERFGDEWCLSPEQSLSMHTGNWSVPKQLLVRSPKGGNKPTGLLFDTSIFDLRLALPPKEDMETKDGLRVFNLPASLISCSPLHFTARPIELRAALVMIRDASDVLHRLLAGGRSTIAARLAGAMRNIGRDQIADNIVKTMQAAGYAVNETDPFEDSTPITFSAREISPYVNRMRMSWARMRTDIVKVFPPAPGVVKNKASYMKQVDEVYVSDAYNSLSIEGYKVSAELIERVRSGKWNPDSIKSDQNHRDALAARGYWQAFQSVRQSIEKVLAKGNAGAVAGRDHATWYRELFAPSVTAGLLKPADLAGYRNGPVYIRRSMHVPPGVEAVRDLMQTLFALLQAENEPAVRVVLGHFMFVYTHPYLDGNGRMGRFLMNVMLASGGYPWTIVPLERRSDYMAALESASVGEDIMPFAKLLAKLVSNKKRIQ
jgi:hypothetical protein